MNRLDFERLALSDPNSSDPEFLAKAAECPKCAAYLAEVQKLDLDISKSLEVTMPRDLVARLQLNQEMISESQPQAGGAGANNVVAFAARPARRYAIAASFAAALFVAGFWASNQWNQTYIEQDYRLLLSAVMDHLDHAPITPVWGSARANQSVNASLAAYGGGMRLKYLESLQFGRLCPMGRYRGLHATLDTSEGQVTFAYIKGVPVDQILDAGYEGYMSRIKPLKDGNLVILSRTEKGLNEAYEKLDNAIEWEI